MASDPSAAPAPPPAAADPMTALAVLGDASRCRLLDFVRRAPGPVTREEAAAAARISRKLAAHHLDQLVASGLLRSRRGPQGHRVLGRAPKVYEPGPHVAVIGPPQHGHELLASLLAGTLAGLSPGEDARGAALRAARERGAALGRGLSPADATALLESLGYAPAKSTDGRTVLHTCPFRQVAAEAPGLVCGLNLAFLRGCFAACGDGALTAVPVPHAGLCCVELRPAPVRPDVPHPGSGDGPPGRGSLPAPARQAPPRPGGAGTHPGRAPDPRPSE
ncbi:helix-turn-helix domain-containing protein [Streptomyces tropicalis]|uniref:Helix-turn-helix domain-containing protein n=1 Tax=Streptomyces tropicalis TaxID=3034234 RepID=A0ABT6A2C6_9ACTN|nr:helix-turn-helix domain-containing protein [Streptomyces tropicalis]MDF3298801.1 helix-turn-helix domain-containing protein [Streptomyces tropicalis]